LNNNFTNFTLGNIGTIVTILVALWGFHQSNKKRIEENAKEFQTLKDQVARLVNLEPKFAKIDELNARLDVIWPVFSRIIEKSLSGD
jgi:hypothetical protein